MGEKQCIEKERRKKYVLTMARYACDHHHRWWTQTAWEKKLCCKKVDEFIIPYLENYL